MKRTEKLAVCGALLLVILVIVIRRPDFFLEPRFWAEEGRDYFADAWNLGFWRGILLQHFGYYAIVPSVATGLATLLPLELAPLFTTCCAGLFQVLVSSLVIFGRSPYWDTWPKKLLIACGIQLINAPEVWLTTICIQYWICIAAFFILLEPEGGGGLRRWFQRVMLGIAGLSSVLSLFLTPLFLLKAWRGRVREFWMHVGILSVTGLVQAAVFIGALLGRDSHVAVRFGQNEFDLLNVLRLNLLEPFAGGQLFMWPSVVALDEWFVSWLARQGWQAAVWPRLSMWFLLSAMTLYVLVLLLRDLRNRQRMLIPLAFLLVAVLSTVLSLKMSSGPRYAFAPSAMLLVLFVNEAFDGRGKLWRTCGVAVLLLTALGATTEFQTRFLGGPAWPQWREEVRLWESGQTEKLLIWPQFRGASWDVELRRK